MLRPTTPSTPHRWATDSTAWTISSSLRQALSLTISGKVKPDVSHVFMGYSHLVNVDLYLTAAATIRTAHIILFYTILVLYAISN